MPSRLVNLCKGLRSAGTTAEATAETNSLTWELVDRLINGQGTCKKGTQAISVTSDPDGDSFSIQNGNGDNTWHFYFEGQDVGHYFVGFNDGYVVAGVGERHNSSDSAWGTHKGLDYMGSGGAWHDWSGTYGESQVEPDYYYCEFSDVYIGSRQDQNCPA